MSTLIFILVFFIATAYGIYKLITGLVIVPTSNTINNVQMFQKERTGVIEDLKKVVFYPIVNLVAPHISIDRYKREKLARNLKRADYVVDPEHFYAEALVGSIYIAIFGVFILFSPIEKAGVIGVIAIILAVAKYFATIDKLNDKLKERNSKILSELPRFIRTYNHSRSQNTPLLVVIEKYRKVAGEAFQYDLDVLIAELKTKNAEEALRDFDARINIPHLSQFVAAVISTIQGINQDVYFAQLEREMNILARENIRIEINARPEKVKAVTLISACMIFVVLLYPLIMTMIDSLSVIL